MLTYNVVIVDRANEMCVRTEILAQETWHGKFHMFSSICWKISGIIKRLQVIITLRCSSPMNSDLRLHLNRVIYLSIISDCFCYMFSGVNSDFSH